jgi:MFS transporter, DHA1 family, inner membrane transport protein
MEDTTATERVGVTTDRRMTRMPWASLLVLGAATFVMVTAEMVPTAVLPEMSEGLGVSEAQTGLLVSVWAAVVVVGSFPLVRLTQRFDRRAVIVWSLVALAASVALTALAPAYPVAVAGRLAGALSVGLLWATTNAFTADLVADRDLARAVAVVLGGATLGMVIGTPITSLVAQGAGWRAAFWGLAIAALAAAVLVRTIVRAPNADVPWPAGSSTDAASKSSPIDASPVRGGVARSLRPMVALVALIAMLLVGHYGTYTYITRLVEAPAGAVPGGIGTMLLVFGLASAAGVVVAGRFGARTERAIVVSAIATGAGVAALGLVAVHPIVGIAVLVLWGVASGALPPLAQTMILRLAGTERRALAGALIPVVFNLGIAIGAALASLVVGAGALESLPLLGAAVTTAAALGLVVTVRRTRRTTTPAA